jgi:transposase
VPDFIIKHLNFKDMQGFLGIDASKGYSDFVLLDPDKNVLEPVFQLDDTRSGHQSLKEVLYQFISKHGITELLCGIESTGGLENNWYSSLIEMSKEMAVKVARLNPNGVKKNSEAGLKRNRTDGLSAKYIAEYLIGHADKIDYREQDCQYASFRSVYKSLQMQNKQKTQLINQIKISLYSAFPEMTRYCKSGMPGWVLEMLKKYPTAADVSKLKAQKLAKINHLTLEKANDIIERAKKSVASRKDHAQAFVISNLAEEIEEKEIRIKKIKKFLETNCKGDEVALLQTIKGIGSFSAACIMIEIEDIKRFPTAKHLVSYFGMHPELKESGDKKLVAHISKKGRPGLRATLFMCAQSAVLYDPHIKQIYHNHRTKGKNHYQAIGVIMHKMLRIAWGILSSKQPYDSTIDQANQTKRLVTGQEAPSQELKIKRRYQDIDLKAPVSNRQHKKRIAHLES